MKISRSYIFSSLLALLWLALAVSLYYVTHTPFTPALAARLAWAVWQVAVAFALVSLGGGVGARWVREIDLHPLARLAFRAGLGLGLLSILYLLVGAALGVSALVAWTSLLALSVFFWRDILTWWRDFEGLGEMLRSGGKLGRLTAFCTAALFLFALGVALAPPLKFDSLVYHLTMPRAYLGLGRITYLPELMYWGFPQTPHMLYTWALSLGAERAAVISWAMGGLAILGLLGYVGQRFTIRYGWIAVGSLMSSYSLAASLGWGYVDWPSLLAGLAFLISMDLWRAKDEGRYLLLAGAAAGIAAGMKYTAGVLLLAGIGVVLWHKRRAFWRPALEFVLAAGAMFSPWLVKNMLATGNPAYPLLYPAGEMTPLRLELYQGQTIQGDWRDALLLPIRATYWGIEAAHVGEDGPGYEASIGPLLMGLGALAGLGWRGFDERQRSFVSTAAIIALSGLAVWAVAGRLSGHLIRTHLYYSLFPAFAALAAVGFAGLERRAFGGVRFGRLAGALVALVLGLNLIQVGVEAVQRGGPQVVLGVRSEEDYLNDNLGLYALVMRAIGELPGDGRVLMLWEGRSYYCAPRCRPDETLDRWLDDLDRVGDAGALPEYWRSQGFDYVLYYRTGAEFVRERDARLPPESWASLDRLLGELPVAENFSDAYILYSLQP